MLEFLLWPVFVKFVLGIVACCLACGVGFLEARTRFTGQENKWYEKLILALGAAVAGGLIWLIAHP